jgi:hypothetical protein
MQTIFPRYWILLGGLGFVLTGCGSPIFPGHAVMLQSIRVVPAPMPIGGPPGVWWFDAGATYSDGSTASTARANLTVQWYLGGPPWLNPTVPAGLTVSNDGMAKVTCGDFAGTSSIVAVAPADPSMPVSTNTGANAVVGSAQVACP